MRLEKKQKAQSVLEYLLVWTAIVSAVILFASTLREKTQQGMQTLTDQIKTTIDNCAQRFNF
jgi:hypothetical protein